MSVNNILKGLKLKGYPAEIPDCSRSELPEVFKKLGYKKGVEIGTYKAAYTELFAKSGLEIYGVDPWLMYRDYGNPKGQKRLDFQYEHSLRVLKPYPNAHLIRKTSMDALVDFKDESIDFVYIDGNHSFKYVAEDIYEWARKVRQGGMISGHDYIYTKSTSWNGICHVRPVLEAYMRSFNIRNFWVLGNRKPKGKRLPRDQQESTYYDTWEYQGKKEKRDRWRSWMFLKDYKNWPYIINN
ncbi:MAG: class I SAM-dependent methyltransferase [Candidatus Heimdallarchaeaceae archaeon]